MAPPKAQTLQERFGFQDDDLKLTTHDDIMHWVHANIDTIVNELFGEWAQKRWESLTQSCLDEKKKYDLQLGRVFDVAPFVLSAMPPLKISKVQWEVVVSSKSGFTVGFIDMQVDVGFWSILSSPSYEYSLHSDTRPIYFEIKTKLPTAGELLRQIRLYQSHVAGAWVVVCPDNRHAAILRDQGISFYKSPVGS